MKINIKNLIKIEKNGIDITIKYNSKNSRGIFSKLYPIKWKRKTLDLVNDFYKEDFDKFNYKMI